jgi:dolichyl-phosphate beta-glucosyltransferase
MNAEKIVWIIPCFDEAARLDEAGLLTLADQPFTSLLFVDDGSRDPTLARLQELAGRRPDRIAVLAQPRNQGKAEAIRQGMLQAFAGTSDLLGFVDADLATPPSELHRLVDILRAGDCDVVFGSRVQLLGRNIDRNPMRHYMGRLFATCASLSLALPVYDTQCGAKAFRRSELVRRAFSEPFYSRWAFDVELLGRLVRPGRGQSGVPVERFREEPLRVWTDVPGSKLKPAAALQTGLELARIAWKLRRS